MAGVLELSLDECCDIPSWTVCNALRWCLRGKMNALKFTHNDDDYTKLIDNVEFGNVREGRSAKLFYRGIHVATLNRESNLNYVADRLISIHHLHTLFP